MIKAPAPALIHQAELRCARSALEVRGGLHSLLASSRAALARPSMLVIVAGVSGLFGFWVARRTRSHATYPTPDLVDAATTSVLGLALAWLLRLGMRRLASAVRK